MMMNLNLDNYCYFLYVYKQVENNTNFTNTPGLTIISDGIDSLLNIDVSHIISSFEILSLITTVEVMEEEAAYASNGSTYHVDA